jgi:hypothetical protein
LSPHHSRYRLNAKIEEQEQFEREVEKICETYLSAEENERKGIHTISTDEKTGIQALERIAPNRPMEPGKPERIEYEYKRHGTTCLFGNRDVGRGGILSPFLNPTRTEEDFARNINMIVATAPEAGWIFVSDNLNTHQSESLVLAAADMLGIDRALLGKKEKYGILKSMASRKAFLEDESHRIRFVYTPKHCSWLNQIEVWFSGLSSRILRRGSFDSVETLNRKIRDYITFYDQTAKPMNWKCPGLSAKVA